MSGLWPGGPDSAINYISRPPSAEFAAKFPRQCVIMGSTGSIGRSALRVVEQAPDRLHVLALAGGNNIALLAEQAERFRPPYLAVLTQELAGELKGQLSYRPEILWGRAGYAALASLARADLVLSAQAGSAGLCATLAAALAGKVIALANKESLALAGGLLRGICRGSGAAILPVDSEHYALFQCAAGRASEIKALLLTASGGPFLGKAPAEIARATPEQALRHPNWSMGAKISIDSATMMNKGLELIEAMHLYGLDPKRIRVLVHPQSIVHSLVEFADNSMLGQFAAPDMRLAIAGCLLWPKAGQSFIPPLHLAAIGQLDFREPDLTAFPCLKLAREAAECEPGPEWRALGLNPACIALNAANEAAVALFLKRGCRFGAIAHQVAAALDRLPQAPRHLPAAQAKAPAEAAAAIADAIDAIAASARQAAAGAASP